MLNQWTLVESNFSEDVYIDISTIEKFGQYKRVWTKTEYDSNSIMSQKVNTRSDCAYREFDCREKKYRTLIIDLFKQSNLMEPHLSFNEPDEWQFITTGTIAETKLKIVCKSK